MKSIMTFILLAVSLVGYGQQSDSSTCLVIDSIARSQLGVSYKYATCDPGKSFDCSGFASFVYESVGVPNSRSSKGYGSLGRKIELTDARKGDCIVFCGTKGSKNQIGHVGIVLQNDDSGLFFIHCSSSKNHPGVVITNYYESNYPNRFIAVRRLFE